MNNNNKSMPNMPMGEGFDFMKKMWGGFPIPSAMAPTVDVDELDKRIADLRTVEQWLNLNLNLLRASIQGLEVQRGTLAALRALGGGSGVQGGASTAGQDPSKAFMDNAAVWWGLMQDQFSKVTEAAMSVQKSTESPVPKAEAAPPVKKPSAPRGRSRS